MARIVPLKIDSSPDDVEGIFHALEHKMGRVPNIFLTMGHSPPALEAYLTMSEDLSKTSLSKELCEKIALLIAEINQCRYCIAAHTAVSKGIGFDDAEILKARRGESNDPRTGAILDFVRVVLEKKANVGDEDVAALKRAGLSDKEIVEVFLAISSNMFTNYFNMIADPDLDFPEAPSL